jgi:hypothetical protein
LQAFWTRPTGIVILAAHDKTGDEVDQRENTRVWSQIDSWATHHIWGRDEKGLAVSTAADITNNKVTHALDRKPPRAEVVSCLVRGPAPGDKDTNGKVIETTAIATRFEALPDGLRIRHDLALGKSERLTELWCTLPVFLRNAAQSRIADTTIDYWTGSAWMALDAKLTETTKLRLGREFDAGPQHAYVHFDQARRVKLSQNVWQASYQSRNRLRNVHIDLHGKPGTAQSLADQSLEFSIRTKNSAK